MQSACIGNNISSDWCMGCSACKCVCPTKAISMICDAWGYYIPKVDEAKCIGCGKCRRKCPVLTKRIPPKEKIAQCYEYISADEKNLANSSSGGAFSAIACKILQNHGAVVGAAWEETTMMVEHVIIYREEDLYKLQQSKYMQSNVNDIFEVVKSELISGKQVLFVGTPCQVEGLKRFLDRDYEGLILIDLFCANAPSAMFFKKYLQDFRKRISKYSFRDKKDGWGTSYGIKIVLEDGRIEYRKGQEDIYQRAFHHHMMCSVHCEKCNFQNNPRVGDLSIGDFWGVNQFDEEIDCKEGVSAIIVNTQKGRDVFKTILKPSAKYIREVAIEKLGGNGMVNGNPNWVVKKARDKFYDDILTCSFQEAESRAYIVDREENIFRTNSALRLCQKWIVATEKGMNLANKLSEQGIHSVAIYGFGFMGKTLLNYLNEKNVISIDYMIDKEKKQAKDGVSIYRPWDKLPKTDLVIVTIEWDYENIKKELARKNDIRVESLMQLLSE